MPPSFHFNTWSDALLREGEIATPLGQEVVQGAPEEGPTGKRSLRIRHRMKTRDIGQWQGAFSLDGSLLARTSPHTSVSKPAANPIRPHQEKKGSADSPPSLLLLMLSGSWWTRL